MYVPRDSSTPGIRASTGKPVAPWSSYRKSVQNAAPPAKRPVPHVRGNSSPNGHPAGAGSFGSGRSAAGGTPSGIPPTTTGSGLGGVVTACSIASATRRATRTGKSARFNSGTTLNVRRSARRGRRLVLKKPAALAFASHRVAALGDEDGAAAYV